jgi:hypothetical protein
MPTVGQAVRQDVGSRDNVRAGAGMVISDLAQILTQSTRLENAEQAMMKMAAELQAAAEKVRAQGKQIEELQKDATGGKTENMKLKLHLQRKKEQIDELESMEAQGRPSRNPQEAVQPISIMMVQPRWKATLAAASNKPEGRGQARSGQVITRPKSRTMRAKQNQQCQECGKRYEQTGCNRLPQGGSKLCARHMPRCPASLSAPTSQFRARGPVCRITCPASSCAAHTNCSGSSIQRRLCSF